jgi:ribosomal-protein-serine acetyltransferase
LENSPILCIAIDDETQLRLHEARYAEEFLALIERNRAHIREWQAWVGYESSLEDIRIYTRNMLMQFADKGIIQTGIWHQSRLVGAIGYPHLDWEDHKVEIGYWIDAGMQGRGIVTKACRTLVTYAFEQYNLNKVEIHCATGNTRSRAVPERLGFTQEGTIRQAEWLNDHYVDMVIYGMLASEWTSRHH